jgi:tetratricopeptide (TPR) repeat protein
MPFTRATIFPAVIGSLWLYTVAAPGQGVQEAGTAEREERAVQMSEGVYRRLNAIHEFLSNEDFDSALSRLDDLRAMRLSPYEEALVYQAYGFCYASQGDYDRAIEAFERCLDVDALPNDANQGMLFSLATLYSGESEFQKAIDTMRVWFSYAQEPVPADAYMVVGTAHAQLEQLTEALPYVQEAIARAAAPNEQWYVLELSILFDLEDYTAAAALLRDMVVYWPETARYWEMLANAYLELEDDENALATLMVAYQKGMLEEEAKLLSLARLNLYLDVPYAAGKLLDAEMSNGRVARNQRNLELLLSAWIAAREFESAAAVIDELAPLTDDGEYFMQKAQLLNELSDWAGVVEATEQALGKGGLADPGSALILNGVAHMQLGRFGDALAALERARDFDIARRNADAWIAYIRDRQRVADIPR